MTTAEELKKPVSTRIARHMLGESGEPMPTTSFNKWINKTTKQGKRRMIVPLVEVGQGESNIFSVQQLVALGCAKAAMATRHSLELSWEICDFLQRLDPVEIERSVGEGRTIVVAAEVNAKVKVFGLMEQAQIDLDELAELKRSAKSDGHIVSLCLVDILPLLTQLTQRLHEQEKLRIATKKKRYGKK